jgi:hypothetical protein
MLIEYGCLNCGGSVRKDAKYCHSCGKLLDKQFNKIICAKCSEEIVYMGMRPNYCGNCGGSVCDRPSICIEEKSSPHPSQCFGGQ